MCQILVLGSIYFCTSWIEEAPTDLLLALVSTVTEISVWYHAFRFLHRLTKQCLQILNLPVFSLSQLKKSVTG
jgi:hypothetical protein